MDRGSPMNSGAGPGGFTLVELLVSMTILAFILATLTGAVSMVANTWQSSEERVEAFQSARGALEMITREMTPASIDTKMQFAVMPGSLLEDVGADFIAPNSPAVFWMAPLGLDGEMRCVGYYLYRNDERRMYRLKRYYVGRILRATSFLRSTPPISDSTTGRHPASFGRAR